MATKKRAKIVKEKTVCWMHDYLNPITLDNDPLKETELFDNSLVSLYLRNKCGLYRVELKIGDQIEYNFPSNNDPQQAINLAVEQINLFKKLLVNFIGMDIFLKIEEDIEYKLDSTMRDKFR